MTGDLREEYVALHTRVASAFHGQYVRWVSAMAPAERDALLVGLPALVRAMHSETAPWKANAPAGTDGARDVDGRASS